MKTQDWVLIGGAAIAIAYLLKPKDAAGNSVLGDAAKSVGEASGRAVGDIIVNFPAGLLGGVFNAGKAAGEEIAQGIEDSGVFAVHPVIGAGLRVLRNPEPAITPVVQAAQAATTIKPNPSASDLLLANPIQMGGYLAQGLQSLIGSFTQNLAPQTGAGFAPQYLAQTNSSIGTGQLLRLPAAPPYLPTQNSPSGFYKLVV